MAIENGEWIMRGLDWATTSARRSRDRLQHPAVGAAPPGPPGQGGRGMRGSGLEVGGGWVRDGPGAVTGVLRDSSRVIAARSPSTV